MPDIVRGRALDRGRLAGFDALVEKQCSSVACAGHRYLRQCDEVTQAQQNLGMLSCQQSHLSIYGRQRQTERQRQMAQ